MQDVDKFIAACEAIVDQRGVRLNDFGRLQNGQRIEGDATGCNNGGDRTKAAEAFLGGWWHADAAEVKKEKADDLAKSP